MQLNLVIDRTIRGKIYPSLAQWEARPYTLAWREFGQHYPYTVPFRLQEYCDTQGIVINLYGITDSYPLNSFYPIGLGFFDFAIDYFALLPDPVFDAVKQKQLQVLFYYHEGDNPQRIKARLDALCIEHELSEFCYKFISGNTSADSIPGFMHFCDFELWYFHRNRTVPALTAHLESRERDFTALNRLHKTWRATVMADLQRNNILDNSYWSYCESGSIVDEDNPIQIDAFPQLRYHTQKFLNHAPYISDDLTQEQRNDHSVVESKYFVNSYCNIVIETHFDADGCYGTFLTEKTFKPIKHGQLFFIAGPAGSLDLLRNLGYSVFDDILDNHYDTNVSSTQRWELLRDSISKAKADLPNLYKQAHNDILHNQQLFAANKASRLNSLIRKINEQYY